MADRLASYRGKRDLDRSGEPAGGRRRRRRADRFVIHEHHARRLHWDLRLERDGVLVSFALPNALPERPGANHLAVHVEDHPLDYIDFEGDIPAGSYGAGSIRIWDRGTYETEKWEDRKIVVRLAGERVAGSYALFPINEERDWMIHRVDPPQDPGSEPLPSGVAPMLARIGTLPADDEAYAYEVKWDGVRALAYCVPGRIRLFSRNQHDVTTQYPELRGLTRALGARQALLDGEIVALDERGRPSFGRLQQRMHLASESTVRRRARDTPVHYVIFDLLHLDGRSLMGLPYLERRAALAELELDGPAWRVSPFHVGDGAALLAATAEQGLEGIIAKRTDCPYTPGKRAAGWIKIKNKRSQELVVGGWAPGKGNRSSSLGALLVGYYEDGALRYAGNVGSGFDERELTRLGRLLAEREREDSPFADSRLPRGSHFVEPELVAEVEFGEWTREGRLRHPVYKGLRDDKDAREVIREPDPGDQPAEPPPKAGPARRRRSRKPGDGKGPATGGLAALLEGGERTRDGGAEVEIDGRTLRFSNLDKPMYPAAGFTKGDVIDYYLRVAPLVLPHLRDRPLTLKRYPDGVEGQHFYEKNCPKHRPDWVDVAPVSSSRSGTIEYCLAQDSATLAWMANLADLELHTSLSLRAEPEEPTMLVFDLDPGAPAGLTECCGVALLLRGLFDELKLSSYVKTSGSKGAQLYVPLNGGATYDQTKPFAHAVAGTLERGYPDLVVSRMGKHLRAGKVLIDWSQNDRHKTTVTVYSLRATERPQVSLPLGWEEVERAAAGDHDGMLDAPAALARLERVGDLFAPLLTERQVLPRI